MDLYWYLRKELQANSSVKQDWETFRFYKLYNNLIRGNSTNSSKENHCMTDRKNA